VQASVMDLRKRMREIIRALERNESVTLFYRGKKKGVIHPHRDTAGRKVEDHDFFGAGAENEESVEEEMDRLRGKRY
jgi:hypothetical protein